MKNQRQNQKQVYAIVETYKWEWRCGDYMFPFCELVSDVTIKEVVETIEEAKKEVKRLNRLNKEKDCKYSFQTTRMRVKNG